MSKNGFTLVELLITISIITILSAIGLVAYSSVVKQGRDSKRQSDLRSIQSALEQYHNDQGFYPTATGLDNALATSPSPAFISSTGNPSPLATVKTYMNSLPQDLQSTPRYKYEAFPSSPICDNTAIDKRCKSYCLYAKLENSSPNNFTAICPNLGGYNFLVTPP